MEREAFLNRVRRAAASGRQYAVHTRDDFSPRVGYSEIAEDLCDRLALEVNAVGGHAYRVASDDEALATLGKILGRCGARSAYLWQHEVLNELGMAHWLRERGVASFAHDDLAGQALDAQRREILAAEIGITSADYALAETGTLALFAKPGQERLASLAPPLHVAIVRRRQVLADLFDLFERLQVAGPTNLPSNLVFITGPSKTGDIELRLVTGVHGPREWHVIVIA